MKLLMHTCCAPCSVYCIDELRNESIEPTIYWFNPNIHPYNEYKARRDCLRDYTKSINVNAIFNDNYGLVDFCKNTINHLNTRCKDYCYPIRLEQTAKYAKENGYDAITTTLLVSPYQQHDIIHQLGDKIAENYGLKFLYRDFRVGFRDGQAKARELGLYMQKYCGCIFSGTPANYDSQNFALEANKETEKRIRLSWDVPSLELKPYKNGNQDEIQFIYNLKKEVYRKYVEKYFKEWNEENQKKLFQRFMKVNSKNIELIYLKDELVGFYNGQSKDDNNFEIGNICVKPEYQNKGIGTAVLKEILFGNKGKKVSLQCFKDNPVIKLYERMGFEKTDETETHYIMKKENY